MSDFILTITDDGSKYVGQFKDGEYHGKGTLYLNGKVHQKGTFENGEYVGK